MITRNLFITALCTLMVGCNSSTEEYSEPTANEVTINFSGFELIEPTSLVNINEVGAATIPLTFHHKIVEDGYQVCYQDELMDEPLCIDNVNIKNGLISPITVWGDSTFTISNPSATRGAYSTSIELVANPITILEGGTSGTFDMFNDYWSLFTWGVDDNAHPIDALNSGLIDSKLELPMNIGTQYTDENGTSVDNFYYQYVGTDYWNNAKSTIKLIIIMERSGEQLESGQITPAINMHYNFKVKPLTDKDISPGFDLEIGEDFIKDPICIGDCPVV